MSFFGATGHCFGFLVTSPLGFKARVGCLNPHCGGERNVCSMRSTSGATLADLLAVSKQPVLSPTYCCRGEVARIQTRALRISVSQRLYQVS